MISLLKEAISKIEGLEQELAALKNEKTSDMDIQILQDALSHKELELDSVWRLVTGLRLERDTLNQALRIVASHGKIDPAKETARLESEQGHNHDQKN